MAILDPTVVFKITNKNFSITIINSYKTFPITAQNKAFLCPNKSPILPCCCV
jgi:hypothetical protein